MQYTAETFPLTVGDVALDYMKIPNEVLRAGVLYHYTTRAGLEGILSNGGLRATYRMRMKDLEEFQYARNIIYETLHEVDRREELPRVAQSIATYTRKNLDQFLQDSVEYSSSYCGCLTVLSDDCHQWANYAEQSEGFAIGFNFEQFLNAQRPRVERGEPYVFSGPVTYNEEDQRALVGRLIETGIHDLQTFEDTCSQEPEDLTAFRDRITWEIVVQLLTLIDFIKHPDWMHEREIRLMLSSNDGTLKASNIQHYERGDESIPYIFIDMLNPTTRRLPLAEIKIGPKASYSQELDYVERLLDDCGYGGGGYQDRPRITHSQMAED